MKRKLLKLTFALFATMVCSSVNATTTTRDIMTMNSHGGRTLMKSPVW